MATINTLIASRYSILCEGVKCLFDSTPFEMSHSVRELADAVAILEEGLRVDLILSEVYDDFADFVHFVKRGKYNPKIVVLAADQSPLPANFPFGEIDGLLGQYVSPTALMRSLELVMFSERIYPFDAAFLPYLREPEEPAIEMSKELDDLSLREIEILRCLALGYPNKTIARQLKIAETTVKAHVKTILRKTKAVNRTQAAMWSISRGLGVLNMGMSGPRGGADVNGIEGSRPRPALAAATIEYKAANEAVEVSNGRRNQIHVLNGTTSGR